MFTGENAIENRLFPNKRRWQPSWQPSCEVSVHTFNFNDGIHEGDLSGFDPTDPRNSGNPLKVWVGNPPKKKQKPNESR